LRIGPILCLQAGLPPPACPARLTCFPSRRNNLPALDAAIAHSEAVLAAVQGRGARGARMQQLASVTASMDDYTKLENIAQKAQRRAQRLDDARQRDLQEAQAIQYAEDEWLNKAQVAQAEADALRAKSSGRAAMSEERRSDSGAYSQLEKEKALIKERLAKNEEEMAQVKDEQAPPRRARRHPRRPLRDSLESELSHEKAEYLAARSDEAPRQDAEARRAEVQRNKRLEGEIAKYRRARHELVSRMQRKIAAGAALRRGHATHESHSVLDGVESALQDSALPAAAVGKAKKAGKASSDADRLPGVNQFSWWSAPPAKKEDEAQLTEEFLHKAHERGTAQRKGGCHDLYTCVDSMFGGKRKSKLEQANEAWRVRNLRQKRLAAEQAAREAAIKGKVGEDSLVSTSQVEEHPDAPLLGVLAGDSHQHDSKLPGVAENRWGGSRFWSRLLGAPSKGEKVHVH